MNPVKCAVCHWEFLPEHGVLCGADDEPHFVCGLSPGDGCLSKHVHTTSRTSCVACPRETGVCPSTSIRAGLHFENWMTAGWQPWKRKLWRLGTSAARASSVAPSTAPRRDAVGWFYELTKRVPLSSSQVA
jgi:hypothetical protein